MTMQNQIETEARDVTMPGAPNLSFSHMGISVKDIERMEHFYTGVLGFTVTDRGNLPNGLQIVFMSRDPMDHHQVILATGRPDNMPSNTIDAQFGASINQIAFRMSSIADLRDIKERLDTWGSENMMVANHGIAWSIYVHDPEGNNLEFFVDSDWYIDQPFLIPLDLTKSDAEILETTLRLCEETSGFEPYSDWRSRVAQRMTRFRPPSFEG